MSKSDLKAAMESLQIKKPFRLPSKQPQFKAPTPVAPSTEVENETTVITNTGVPNADTVYTATSVVLETKDQGPTQVEIQTLKNSATQVPSDSQGEFQTEVQITPEVPAGTTDVFKTQVEKETSVVPETWEQTNSPIASQTLVSKESQIVDTTKDIVQTQVTKTTQVPITYEAPREQISACIQDSSIKLESDAASKLSIGYTKLPDSILMRMLSGEFIKSEMQIILVVARFTISFQRRYAPLSKSVLERQTGLRGPAILQAVGSLCENGVLEKIPGDQYRPNQLGLKFDDEYDFFTKKGTTVDKSTSVQSDTEVVKSNSAQVESMVHPQVDETTHFKDTSTNKNEFSLSRGESESSINEYLKNLKPLRKQQSEIQAYQELIRSFTSDEVSNAFDFLVATDPERTKFHSPMAYLAVAMEQVLKSVKGQQALNETSRQKQVLREQLQRDLDLARDREEAIWNQKVRRFNEFFSTNEEQMREIQKRVPPLIQGTELRKNLAISSWATEMNLD